jgi:hypothetical protein
MINNTNSACSNDWKPQINTGLYWTKTKPTESGYYWCSIFPDREEFCSIVKVENIIDEDGASKIIGTDEYSSCDINDYTDNNWWYGPIKPPIKINIILPGMQARGLAYP